MWGAIGATAWLAGWHISNEYSGACYCGYCLAAFRAWLKTRYPDLGALNRAYWSAFWAQSFQAWDQIDPRESMDGLNLHWDRFVTHQTVDLMKNEIAPRKAASPALPVTTNMMGFFAGLDYWRFVPISDRMSWDAYPQLRDWRQVAGLTMTHDPYRTMKGGLPFLLMESTPSNTNWQQTPSLKEAGPAPPGDADRDRPRRRHGHVLPVAEEPRCVREDARRGRGPRGLGAAARVPGSGRPRGRAAQARRRRGHDAAVEVALVNDWEVRWASATRSGRGAAGRGRPPRRPRPRAGPRAGALAPPRRGPAGRSHRPEADGRGQDVPLVHDCTNEEKTLDLGAIRLVDVADGTVLTGRVTLPAFASRVVSRR